MDDLYWLDQVQPLDRKIVGEKAYYLSWLKQRGYRIPPSVVISASVLQQGLAQVNWPGQLLTDLPNSFLYVDANQPRQLQMVAQQLRQVVAELPVPAPLLQSVEEAGRGWQTPVVIVRPSFATELEMTQGVKTTGLLTSQLCQPEPEALTHSIQQVWAELFSARSLFYWQRLRLQLRQIQLAVLVQPVQSVVAAGTVQICDQRVQIQATWGLGFGLIQTGIDTYGLNLASGWHAQQIAEKTYAYEINTQAKTDLTQSDWFSASVEGLQLTWVAPSQCHQPVLTLEQQQQLAQLAHRIQADLKTPVALEWTLSTAEPQFCFTQLSTQIGGWVTLTAGQTKPLEVDRPTPRAAVPSLDRLTGLKAAPGRAVARAWVVQRLPLDLTVVPPGVILVAPVLTPEQVIWLRQVAGVVTEQGGMTSHAAILARELGIPAVVGVAEATRRIQTNDRIALDGDQGEVYIGPQLAAPDWVQADLPPQSDAAEPAAISDVPSSLQIWLTLSQPDRLPHLSTLPVQGVGLIRSELMLLELFQQRHPQEWLHQIGKATAIDQIAARIQRFAAAFAPRPVFYRSLDLQTSEWATADPNPASMLSLRGTLRDLQIPDLFQVQIAALHRVQQQGYDNVMLLLPFVRTVEEFVFCRQQVEQAGLTQVNRFQLWVMAEVPSVLLLLPDYVAAGVQGITIGTNDLTQLLLGIDRNQAQLAPMFNPHHPVVLRAVRQLAETAQRLQIPCAMCSQGLNHQPELLHQMASWGITALSVEPGEVAAIQEILQPQSPAY